MPTMLRHSHSDRAAAKSFEPPADDADLADSQRLGAESAAICVPYFDIDVALALAAGAGTGRVFVV